MCSSPPRLPSAGNAPLRASGSLAIPRMQTNFNPRLGPGDSAERVRGTARPDAALGLRGRLRGKQDRGSATGAGAEAQRGKAPPAVRPEFRAQDEAAGDSEGGGRAGRWDRLGSVFSGFPFTRLGLPPPRRPREHRGPAGRRTAAARARRPPRAALAACPRPGPAHRGPAGATDSRSLPTPRPHTRVRPPAAAPRAPPRRTAPEHAHTWPPNPNRASPAAPEAAGAESKPGWTERLTFNRLDVAMFLQLRLSRDGARFRGARGQAAGGGPAAQQGRAARRPAPGCAGRRGGVPTAPTASRAPGASSLFPATWSPELPHTRELMHTLGEAAAATGEEAAGADLNRKRKHRLREPPHSFGLAFVVAPAATTGNEFSWAWARQLRFRGRVT